MRGCPSLANNHTHRTWSLVRGRKGEGAAVSTPLYHHLNHHWDHSRDHSKAFFMSGIKVDIHNHILPERWPDLKEVNQREGDLLYIFSRGTVMVGGYNSIITVKGRLGCLRTGSYSEW